MSIDLIELAALKSALKECADDLEAYIKDHYLDSGGNCHPALQHRYDRDIAPVLNARKLLEQ